MVHRELRMKRSGFIWKKAFRHLKRERRRIVAHLTSGKSIAADLVLLSIGVKPNTGFLANSEIELGSRGHIDVNEYLKTSNEHIYAAGDAIE
jgi:pyruvate/2-oxoglutarate dehydrogenase complex dihydrolipoamide dehydrogenase (E3) component